MLIRPQVARSEADVLRHAIDRDELEDRYDAVFESIRTESGKDHTRHTLVTLAGLSFLLMR